MYESHQICHSMQVKKNPKIKFNSIDLNLKSKNAYWCIFKFCICINLYSWIIQQMYVCMYYMSKKSCPFLYSDLLYKNGQDFLGKGYTYSFQSILTNNKYKNHNHDNNSYNSKTKVENVTICLKYDFAVHGTIIIILLVKKSQRTFIYCDPLY